MWWSAQEKLVKRAEPVSIAEQEAALRGGLAAAAQIYRLHVVNIVGGLLVPDADSTLQDMVDVVKCFVAPVLAAHKDHVISIGFIMTKLASNRGGFVPHDTLSNMVVAFGELYHFVVHFTDSLPPLMAGRKPHPVRLVVIPTRRNCAACGAGEECALKMCSGCNKVWYCSTECQKFHWNGAGHKLECSK